jgi:phosphatidylinositol 4-kinase
MDIFQEHKLKLWLKPFNIIATSNDGGLIQTIPDAVSIDKIKKSYPHIADLREYFIYLFGSKQKLGV